MANFSKSAEKKALIKNARSQETAEQIKEKIFLLQRGLRPIVARFSKTYLPSALYDNSAHECRGIDAVDQHMRQCIDMYLTEPECEVLGKEIDTADHIGIEFMSIHPLRDDSRVYAKKILVKSGSDSMFWSLRRLPVELGIGHPNM